MVFAAGRGQAKNGGSGIGLPIGRTQSHKGGNEIDAAIIRNGRANASVSSTDSINLQLISQPGNGCTGEIDDAFKGIGGLAADDPGDGRHDALIRINHLTANVEQHR